MTDIAPPLDEIAAERQRAEQEAYAAAGIAYEQPEPDAPEPQPDEPGVPPAAEAQQTLDTEDAERPERRRDPETGQFLPNEQEPEGTFFATYRTREDAERGHLEKDRFIDELKSERDSLRERTRQYEAWVQQQQAQQQRPQTPGNFEEIIDENPAYAAQLAYQAGDQYALRRAAEAWEELAPGAPALWMQNLQMQQQMQELSQRVNATAAPVEEQAREREWESAVVQFNNDNQWFRELSDQEIIAAAERNPLVGALAQQGTPEARITALRTLGLDALQARGQLSAQVQDIARTQAQESERARTEAFVASSTTVTAQTPATPDQAEQERAESRIRANLAVSGWDRPPALEGRLAKLRGHDDPERMERFGFRG